jgi:gamma-glutamyltranspeptidase/glutathione hydrolase
VHHQWQPDTLVLEPGISPDTEALLKSRGHMTDHSPGWVPPQVNAILKNGQWLEGASDGRAPGKAAGY